MIYFQKYTQTSEGVSTDTVYGSIIHVVRILCIAQSSDLFRVIFLYYNIVDLKTCGGWVHPELTEFAIGTLIIIDQLFPRFGVIMAFSYRCAGLGAFQVSVWRYDDGSNEHVVCVQDYLLNCSMIGPREVELSFSDRLVVTEQYTMSITQNTSVVSWGIDSERSSHQAQHFSSLDHVYPGALLTLNRAVEYEQKAIQLSAKVNVNG